MQKSFASIVLVLFVYACAPQQETTAEADSLATPTDSVSVEEEIAAEEDPEEDMGDIPQTPIFDSGSITRVDLGERILTFTMPKGGASLDPENSYYQSFNTQPGTTLSALTIGLWARGLPCDLEKYTSMADLDVPEETVMVNDVEFKVLSISDGAMNHIYESKAYYFTTKEYCVVFEIGLESFNGTVTDPATPDYDTAKAAQFFKDFLSTVKWEKL